MSEDRVERLRQVLVDWAKPPESMVDKLPKGGTTLDYMGHAAVTRALIEVDPEWNWAPVVDEHGIPVIQARGKRLVMWGRLTVLGKTVVCCGTCEDRKFEPEKELIGDLLRNGAMRFGIGLALWSKDEWTDLGTSAPSDGVDQGARDSGGTAPLGGAPSRVPAGSSEQGTAASSDQGGGPAGGPSPASVIARIAALSDELKEAVKEYAHSKGYTVTKRDLTDDAVIDLNAWLDRRAK